MLPYRKYRLDLFDEHAGQVVETIYIKALANLTRDEVLEKVFIKFKSSFENSDDCANYAEYKKEWVGSDYGTRPDLETFADDIEFIQIN